jgi:sorting nexin-8
MFILSDCILNIVTKTSQAPDPPLPIPNHETKVTGPAPPAQSSGSDSQQSYIELEHPETILEEDPNNERRKRLKTFTHVAPHDVETETKTLTRANDAPIAAIGNEDSKQPSSPPRKILKLNTNGKLLSSPLAPSLESKRTSSRRKPQAKGKITKRVVIKYQKDSNIGKKIDDIINGRERHDAPQKAAIQAPVPVKKETKPLKPTHPFFLSKKPVEKVSVEATSTTTKPVDQHDSTNKETEIQSSAKSSFSRSLFSKIPELVPPIWPPKDLVHMRGAFLEYSGTSENINFNLKKSKQRVVHIDETENIFTCESQRILKETQSDISPLRVPTRSVVSGPTLQKGMNSQLSYRLESKFGHGSGYQGEPGRAHPCIAKVYATIGTSMTSFDIGGRDSIQWAQKYSPVCAEDVLQAGPEPRMLRDWLKSLMISTVETGNTFTNKNKKKSSGGRKSKRRKTADKLDGFIVSSEDEASEMDELSDSDEDELAGGLTVSSKRTVIRVGDSVGKFKKGETSRMTNAVLISGPSGCGKSTSVYAVAKELDFEVFEINSGTRRSAKDILERVGDMTQNHLVHLEGKEDGSENDIRPVDPGIPDARQNKVNTFFKPTAQKKPKHPQKKPAESRVKGSWQDSSNLSSRPHKQSLILLEEVDVLFEEDRQFWIGVLALIEQSKRPVIMTCNNEDLVPLQDLSLHAIFRYHAPPPPLAIDYLLVIAANEGHMLKHEAVSDLYSASNQDLRKSIMELDFWCQMAVGSEKSGIDWILDRWPEGSDVDVNGNRLKVISLHTYHQCMGWFNSDVLLIDNGLARESELLLEGRNWWELNFETDGKDGWPFNYSEPEPEHQSQNRLDTIQNAMFLADSLSALDILSHSWSLDQKEVSIILW